MSPSYHTFLMVTLSYHSKETPIGALPAEKIAETVLLYVFRIAFPESLFPKNGMEMQEGQGGQAGFFH